LILVGSRYPESWGTNTNKIDMSFQAGQGRSYKYLLPSVQPLFEFGAGLSYTTFALTAPPPPTPVSLGPSPSSVCANMKNTGAVASQVVVMLFAVPGKLTNPPTLVLIFGDV
jgi:beta-glucosidase